MDVRIDRLEAAIQKIQKIAASQGDLKTFAEPLFKVAEDDVRARFKSAPRVRSSAEVYGGVTWNRLSEAYLQANPRRITGVQLVDTGLLRGSFTRTGEGNVTTESAHELRFGSNLERAIQQHRRRLLVVDHPALGTESARAIAERIEGI